MAVTINQELFQKVLDQIRQHPETHNQKSWQFESSCGTTRCIAGWAIHLATGNRHARLYDAVSELRGNSVCDTARRILGLTEAEAEDLFLETDEEEALRMVERYALKGREE